MRTKEEFLYFVKEPDHKGSIEFLTKQIERHQKDAAEPWAYAGHDRKLDELRAKAYRLSAEADEAHRAFFEYLLRRAETK